jgi:tRNA(Phe) wybutosine-synthesizing methylase Tyw3
MSKGPFINDPREVMRQQIALAVASPIEEVRAIHIRAAEHQAEMARASGLTPNPIEAADQKRQEVAPIAAKADRPFWRW